MTPSPSPESQRNASIIEPMGAVSVKFADGNIINYRLGVLRSYSTFFRVHFDGDFEQANTQTVKSDNPAFRLVFSLFYEWCLHRETRDAQSCTERVIGSGHDSVSVPESFSSLTWRELVDLCLLGEYLGALRLQDDVIDILAKRTQIETPDDAPFHLAQVVWDQTTPWSPLRLYLLDLLTNPNYWKEPDLVSRWLNLLSEQIQWDLLGHRRGGARDVDDEARGPEAFHPGVGTGSLQEELDFELDEIVEMYGMIEEIDEMLQETTTNRSTRAPECYVPEPFGNARDRSTR